MDASFNVRFKHGLHFTQDVFAADNHLLLKILAEHHASCRVLVFMDEGLIRQSPHLPQQLRTWFDYHKDQLPLLCDLHVVPGGEQAKNDPTILHEILQQIDQAGIDRKSYVLAIGGGAVLDVVGFAAATAHRGVRLVRLPTTTLSQDDSGIGVKNGVNLFGKKNFLGTFAVPHAVINDAHFLRTLSDRDWRCGFTEAVKVALIKDAAMFEQIADHAIAIARRDEKVSLPIIEQSALLHLKHITEEGDPFETDHARPLDFGHWSAHKLEQMTNYQLRHGEAVGIGIAIDSCYANAMGYLSDQQTERIIECLLNLGIELNHPALSDVDTLLKGLQEFQEHLGGPLTVTLPNAIGNLIEVHEIDQAVMVECINRIAKMQPLAIV